MTDSWHDEGNLGDYISDLDLEATLADRLDRALYEHPRQEEIWAHLERVVGEQLRQHRGSRAGWFPEVLIAHELTKFDA